MKIHVLEMPDPVGDAIRAEALLYRKCMQGQYESDAYKARRELAKMTARERIQAELVMLKNLTEDCPRATELVQRHGLPLPSEDG